MALLKGQTLPYDAQEAHIVAEIGCKPTLAELDRMPQRLIDTILLYQAVKETIMYGGTLKV